MILYILHYLILVVFCTSTRTENPTHQFCHHSPIMPKNSLSSRTIPQPSSTLFITKEDMRIGIALLASSYLLQAVRAKEYRLFERGLCLRTKNGYWTSTGRCSQSATIESLLFFTIIRLTHPFYYIRLVRTI